MLECYGNTEIKTLIRTNATNIESFNTDDNTNGSQIESASVSALKIATVAMRATRVYTSGRTVIGNNSVAISMERLLTINRDGVWR